MKLTNKTSNYANHVTVVLFVIYLMALCWILLLKLSLRFSYVEERHANFIPFREPLRLAGKVDFGEMILNVLIFVPLGIYAGILFERWAIWKKVGLFFLVSFLVEALQFGLKIGAFDITDIIMNIAGGITGLTLLAGIEKMFTSRIRVQKIINLVAAISTVLMMLFLILLKMNMLPVRYR